MDTVPRWFAKLSLIIGPVLMVGLFVWSLEDADNEKKRIFKNSFSDKVAYIGQVRGGLYKLQLLGGKQVYHFYQLKNIDNERDISTFMSIGDAVAKSANSNEISVFHSDTVFKFRVTASGDAR